MSLTLPVPGKGSDSAHAKPDSKMAQSHRIWSKTQFQGQNPPNLEVQDEEKPGLTKSQPPIKTKSYAASPEKSAFRNKAPSREKKSKEKSAKAAKSHPGDKALLEDKPDKRRFSGESHTSDKHKLSGEPHTWGKRKSSVESQTLEKPSLPEGRSDSRGAPGLAEHRPKGSSVAGESVPGLSGRVGQMEAELNALRGLVEHLVSQQAKDLFKIQEELKIERNLREELQAKFEMLNSKENLV